MFICSRRLLVAVFLMTLSATPQALIVPQELPSILSLVYSNIPPIRKGTDSRLGFGFRLGDHADFQVVVELGPQKETAPLANSDGSSSSKRQVNQKDYKKPIPQPPPSGEESTTGASWLQNWSHDMRAKTKKPSSRKQTQHQAVENETAKGGYINTGPMIPESSLKQLQQLYKMATAESEPIVVEHVTEAITRDTPPRDMLSIISPRHASKVRKTKGEIMDELMDVKLD